MKTTQELEGRFEAAEAQAKDVVARLKALNGRSVDARGRIKKRADAIVVILARLEEVGAATLENLDADRIVDALETAFAKRAGAVTGKLGDLAELARDLPERVGQIAPPENRASLEEKIDDLTERARNGAESVADTVASRLVTDGVEVTAGNLTDTVEQVSDAFNSAREETTEAYDTLGVAASELGEQCVDDFEARTASLAQAWENRADSVLETLENHSANYANRAEQLADRFRSLQTTILALFAELSDRRVELSDLLEDNTGASGEILEIVESATDALKSVG
ncbi:hypothetical protein [Roseibium album]|uniref:Uncharacterized protein n=1 Tax=Roseibium album TaxID=311410 RepID=A0A0M7ABQ9_9HYPH|nr:hypothetical protein [Roseibium album]CTQ58465.1 hypothetical protein LA5094_01226 [Roseibium album]CTQ66542.1 hypothetical protein LA5096_01137 [Roseibium album]CTQ71640.1 hypothetical protein LA5095_02281 [Roseibium album]